MVYTAEQRTVALRMIEGGMVPKHVAQALGLAPNTVYRWVRDAENGKTAPTPFSEGAGLTNERAKVRAAERIEDVEFLLSVGETHIENVARRVGTTPTYLRQFLSAQGRNDLWIKITGTAPAYDVRAGEEMDVRAYLPARRAA